MDSIMEGAMMRRIEEETTSSQQVQLQANPRPAAYPPRSEQNIMVGLDKELCEILEKLVAYNPERLIIPIVGMGGIGKTTLARNVYMHPQLLNHFDIRAWITISQEYSTLEVLRELLSQFNIMSRGDSIEKKEDELGLLLHQCLFNRRYLIILDDMWDIDAWDMIHRYFPWGESGNRIIVTTRLSPLAHMLSDDSESYWLRMSFLDDDKSWDLFCKIVFVDRGCPLELREAGKKITAGCKGLPLSIVVIGGLLTKSEYTREYWEYIGENLNSVLNLEDNERCSNILYLSYNQLPVYLKPCFLYMGVFPEDEVVHVSMLIKLWVAEGFLKPICGKSIELVAQDYVRDLIDRNLILVHKLGSTDNIKYCIIHDLLRDLCLREAQKKRFYNVIKQPIEQDMMNNSIRIVLSECLSSREVNFGASARHARSLICNSGEAPSLYDFRLLRIWKAFDKDLYEGEGLNFLENMSHLVNLRYVAVTAEGGSEFFSSIRRLWNLQTLIVKQVWASSRSFEIWNMPLLRHVEFTELELPDPPSSDDDVVDQNDVVLGNLQTLSRVRNFKCSEQVVRRIPNVKKLIVFYDNLEENSDYCLENVERLDKLESFGFFFFPSGPNLFQNLTFPNSLKKLTISQFHWEEMLEKIGSLPLLEKLKLMNGYLRQRKWETSEEQFCNLKFLRIEGCNLEWWLTDSTHFPRLEHLVLCNLDKLKEIPSDVGYIPTLKSIRLEFCSNSAIVSARKILEEQEYLTGNTNLHVRVLVRGRNRIPKSSKNFQVESIPN